MSESVFGRIARHVTSLGRVPREDRLTEVFAAVLDSAYGNGLARHLAYSWLTSDEAADARGSERLKQMGALLEDSGGEWTCSVTTQLESRTASVRRRPDLELLLQEHDENGSPSEELLLWLEVKNGTGPHDNQLAAYLGLIKARGVKNAAVMLLAPRSDYPSFARTQMPSEVPRLTWEGTGRLISSFVAADPVSAFLVEQLVDYLQEEELMDPPQLTPKHLIAFDHYQEGIRALVRVCDLADARVCKLWAEHEGKPGTWPKGRKPRNYWWDYPPDNEEETISIYCETGWGPQWQFFVDSREFLRDGTRGVPVFVVGLAGPAGGIDRMPDSTRAKLREGGFRLMTRAETLISDYEYAFRVRYPNELFSGGDLASEAEVLANWISTSFADLEGLTEPPPPSSTARERQLRAQERLNARLRGSAHDAGA